MSSHWHRALTLYKKSPDLGLCLELCQHCVCLLHVHVFIQVKGIQEVGYFCKNSQIITCKVSFNNFHVNSREVCVGHHRNTRCMTLVTEFKSLSSFSMTLNLLPSLKVLRLQNHLSEVLI